MLTKILFSLVMLAPVAAIADEATDNVTAGSETEDYSEAYCNQYDGYPQYCNRTANCTYDYQWNACVDRGGGGGGGGNRSCSSYDYDPRLCDSQPGCQYDYNYRRCQDSWNPNPGQQCWQIRDPRQCDYTPGCTFDRRSRTCVDNYNPPNNRTVTRNIRCDSGDYRYERCAVYGQIVSAYLLRQNSNSNCTQGQSWGYDYDAIWVDRGCRGDFQVTYYAQF